LLSNGCFSGSTVLACSKYATSVLQTLTKAAADLTNAEYVIYRLKIRLYLAVNIIRVSHKSGYDFYLLHAAFLPDLFFYPEDGGDVFLINVD
jgi:hypothetical protein